MNYIGSKQKLSSFIQTTVNSIVGDDLSQKTFCDLFAGTGIVGRTFKIELFLKNNWTLFVHFLNICIFGQNMTK
ncbi:hypothetical protein C3L50_11445 [Flavobacterium alvei]|uniref:DNA methyltransferase n=1 Tax=Flavobacterium alvei TaxID=2080416 RepID=A0A2S5A866_9FLAO|nr:DNA adenine methylase [Flavobacterium alvei]POY38745.1 hypothetical protein C3L50_11445 [Flavobacterium alvei]